MDDSVKPYFELVSDIAELNEIHKDIADPLLDEALGLLIKLTVKPEVKISAAAPLVVQLEAIALQLRLKAKYYMLYDKAAEGRNKKNICMTMADGLERLADATKYLIKAHG